MIDSCRRQLKGIHLSWKLVHLLRLARIRIVWYMDNILVLGLLMVTYKYRWLPTGTVNVLYTYPQNETFKEGYRLCRFESIVSTKREVWKQEGIRILEGKYKRDERNDNNYGS